MTVAESLHNNGSKRRYTFPEDGIGRTLWIHTGEQSISIRIFCLYVKGRSP